MLARRGSTPLFALALAHTAALADLTSYPADIDFAQVPLGRSRYVEILLTNSGPDAVVIDAVNASPPFALPAPPVTAGAFAMAVDDTFSLAISFAPLVAERVQSQVIVLASQSLEIPVRGHGTAVRIDEVLADPAAGAAGDANGDGTRHSYEDEFVELVNAGVDTVDVGSWTLSDDDSGPAAVYAFPEAVKLAPGARAVLFGGGVPQGFGSLAFVDDGRIGDGLSNSGDAVLLLDADGDTADAVSGLAWGNNQSVTRSPSGSGGFVPHRELSLVAARHSPGAATALPARPTEPPPTGPPPHVVISEVLADPPDGAAGDANGDGSRHSYEDEFVELHNADSDTVDISGWLVGDDDVDVGSMFRFPDAVLLAPGERVVLFGGGLPQLAGARAFVDDGRIGNGLTNGGDAVVLLRAEGDTIDEVVASSWPRDRSLARWPEGCAVVAPPCAFVTHDAAPGSGYHSAGRARPVTAPKPPFVPPDVMVTEIHADPAPGLDGDANNDLHGDRYEDEFIELFNFGSWRQDLSGWSLSDDDVSPSRRFVFPAGTALEPGAYGVLFGGGVPPALPGWSFADDGRIGDGLTNGGDRILLITADGDTAIDLRYNSKRDIDQSLYRAADGGYRPHGDLPGRGRFSPGTGRAEYGRFSVDTLEVVVGTSAAVPVLRGYDGREWREVAPDGVVWLSYDSRSLDVVEGELRAARVGAHKLDAWLDERRLSTGIVVVRAAPRPPNAPPLISSVPRQLVFASGRYAYDVESEDPEGAELVHMLIAAPEWLTIDWKSGLISGRAPAETTRDTIAVEVYDGSGGIARQQFALHVAPRPTVRIVEVLPDPPDGPRGDADGDGHRETYGDEFVEILNAGPGAVDLGGCTLSDGDVGPSREFRFPPGTVLEPGRRAVLFGSARAPALRLRTGFPPLRRRRPHRRRARESSR